jgi:TM2 domain-containing membrane protein YozV
MSDDNKDLRDDLNEMLGDAKEGVRKAAEKAEELGKEAKEALGGAKEKAEEFAGEAKEKASEFADEAKEAFDKVTGSNKKVIAGVTAILLGGFGIHKFVLGYMKEGIILLAITIVISIFSFGLLSFAVWVFTLIEGVIYLSKTDDEFYSTYQDGKKPWF